MTELDILYINLQKNLNMKINSGELFTEIGGNFWLKPDQWDKKSNTLSKDLFIKNAKDVYYTSSGRGAIRLCLEQIKCDSKIVLLPYFTCDSVIEPFADNGYKIIYYEIETDFSIDTDKLDALIQQNNPSILYLQSYFGFDTLKGINRYIDKLKKETQIRIVEDITHALLGTYNYTNADYYVGSLRKWLEIPDGGILISKDSMIDSAKVHQRECTEIVNLFKEASKLKYDYSINVTPENKDQFRKLFYKAEDLLNNQKEIFPISQVSKYILSTSDFSKIKECRIKNYNFLFQNLSEVKSLNLVFSKSDEETAPLYFCVECKGIRNEVQKKLAAEGIYAPVIWPKSDYLSEIHNNNEHFFYDDLLSIPCDQRYNLSSITNIVNILKNLN